MFEIRLTDEANRDLENVKSFYSAISEDLGDYFIKSFDKAVLRLETFPFFQIRYKNVRLRQLENFPVMLHFVVYEEKNLVIIYGVRFGQENPENYPKPQPLP